MQIVKRKCCAETASFLLTFKSPEGDEGKVQVQGWRQVPHGCHFKVNDGDQIGLEHFQKGSEVITNDGLTRITLVSKEHIS